MTDIAPPPVAAPHPVTLIAGFATGGLLTFMVLLNGTLATRDGILFASWAAHGTGTLAATAILGGAALWARHRRGTRHAGRPGGLRAPLWAYLGGLSGAVTVMLTSWTMNTVLALSGTLALGIVGQVAFGLAADRYGLFGLPRRKPGSRELAALCLILAGSGAILFSERLAMMLPGATP